MLIFLMVAALLLSFGYAIYKNFLSLILVGPMVFAFTVKTPLQLAAGLPVVGYFGFYSSIIASYQIGLLIFGAFWIGFLSSQKARFSLASIESKSRFSVLQHDALIFFLATLLLFTFYGSNWMQGNRIGGTSTVGGTARLLFALLVFSYIMFCFRARAVSWRKISRTTLKLFASVSFFFLILNLAGLRGWSLLGILIVFFDRFNRAKLSTKTFAVLSVFPLLLLKRILSGEGLSFRIGAQGDFVEVIGVLNDMKASGFSLDAMSILNYAIQAVPISIRAEIPLLTSTEEILTHAVPDFLALQMGFNVSTFHVLYMLLGVLCLPLLFLLGRLFAHLINAAVRSQNALNSTLFLLLAMSVLNMGGLKYVTTYTIVLLSIKATSHLSRAGAQSI